MFRGAAEVDVAVVQAGLDSWGIAEGTEEWAGVHAIGADYLQDVVVLRVLDFLGGRQSIRSLVVAPFG